MNKRLLPYLQNFKIFMIQTMSYGSDKNRRLCHYKMLYLKICYVQN